MKLVATILVVAFSGAAMCQDFGGHALFVRTPDADSGKRNATGYRESASSAIEEERGGTIVGGNK